MAEEIENQTDNENKLEMGQELASDPKLQEPSQPSERSEVANKADSPSGDVSQQPASMEDFYKKSESRKVPPSPTRICRKCLQESYGGYESELRGICQDYFKPVSNNLKETDRLDDIVVQLILYCEKYHQFELLWGVIEKGRPNNYEKYYKLWQKAVESMAMTDWLEQSRYETVSDSEKDRIGRSTRDEPHPLASEKTEAINKWFFNELNQQEQSFTLTVALFEGINRKLLGELTREIENRLFDTVQQ